VPSEEQKPKKRQSQQFRSKGPGDFELQVPLPRIDEMLILVHAHSDSTEKLRHSASLRKVAVGFAGALEVKCHAQLVHNRPHD
jgi:hypothetical protein